MNKKKKEQSTGAKIGQTIIFLFLTVGSVILIIGLWDFLYQTAVKADRSRHSQSFMLAILLIPCGFLYGALIPWVKFNGVKSEVTGAQLMSLDEEGCYLGPLRDLNVADAKTIARIFDRESDWRYERFQYSDYAIYIKNAKGGFWLFPDKTDKCLWMTGEPASVMGLGFKISKDQAAAIEMILQRYQE